MCHSRLKRQNEKNSWQVEQTVTLHCCLYTQRIFNTPVFKNPPVYKTQIPTLLHSLFLCCRSAETQTNGQLLLSVGRSIRSVDPNILQGIKTDVIGTSSLRPCPRLCVWSSIGSRCQNYCGLSERKQGIIRQSQEQSEECL